jgi:hypothetical protein
MCIGVAINIGPDTTAAVSMSRRASFSGTAETCYCHNTIMYVSACSRALRPGLEDEVSTAVVAGTVLASDCKRRARACGMTWSAEAECLIGSNMDVVCDRFNVSGLQNPVHL